MKSIAVSYFISCYTAGMKRLCYEIHLCLWSGPLIFPSSCGPMSTLNPCNVSVTTGNFGMMENQRTLSLVKLMLHRPLQTGRKRQPQAEAQDVEEKQGCEKNSSDSTFSAGVLVDEHTWKAPFSWGSIFAGPTVKVCIHRDKILHIYSQHYFIIMLSTPPPKTKTVQNGENSFSSTRTRRPHQRSKNFLPNGFLVGIYNELPQYGTPICVCVHACKSG